MTMTQITEKHNPTATEDTIVEEFAHSPKG